LGDIVYVELPKVGDQVESGKPFGVIESVKTASDLYAPVSGEVVEVNADLVDQPRASTTTRTRRAGSSRFAPPIPRKSSSC
jgi:glycine cleavage system H protein